MRPTHLLRSTSNVRPVARPVAQRTPPLSRTSNSFVENQLRPDRVTPLSTRRVDIT